MIPSCLAWAAVAVLGCAVGASELISRYKDDPGAAIQTWPAVSISRSTASLRLAHSD
jgi:hypothetical protein